MRTKIIISFLLLAGDDIQTLFRSYNGLLRRRSGISLMVLKGRMKSVLSPKE